jgi:hypothetical protein
MNNFTVEISSRWIAQKRLLIICNHLNPKYNKELTEIYTISQDWVWKRKIKKTEPSSPPSKHFSHSRRPKRRRFIRFSLSIG